jgi:DNA-binding MarR family transcriptional regulator
MTMLDALDDAELGSVIKGRAGPAARRQLAIVRRLASGTDGHGEIGPPFLEELAAEFQVTRQAISRLLTKLKRKHLIVITTLPPVPKRRVVKFIYEPEQASLPFGREAVASK